MIDDPSRSMAALVSDDRLSCRAVQSWIPRPTGCGNQTDRSAAADQLASSVDELLRNRLVRLTRTENGTSRDFSFPRSVDKG